jgi:hypothetical protein
MKDANDAFTAIKQSVLDDPFIYTLTRAMNDADFDDPMHAIEFVVDPIIYTLTRPLTKADF